MYNSSEIDYPEALKAFGFYYEGEWKHPAVCKNIGAVVQDYTMKKAASKTRFRKLNYRREKYGSKPENQNQIKGL